MNTVKLEQYCGDTFRFAVSLKDSDGDPVDLKDAEVRFTLALPTPVTHDTEGVDIDVEEGVIDIAVDYQLMQVSPGDYSFDVEVTWEDEVRRTVVLGVLTLRDDVTKPEAVDD